MNGDEISNPGLQGDPRMKEPIVRLIVRRKAAISPL
jgi:hypothetical protein